jgi:hypothetical protein
MAISRISSAAAQTSSATITTPTAGDVILVFAHRDGSTTAPTLPAGYTTIITGNSNTNSERVGFKYSDGTETTSGTWTNATSVAVGVYRGCDPQVPYGAVLDNGGASTTPATSTLTMQAADGTSWVVAFAAHRTATNLNQSLANLTLVTSATDIGISDSNAGVSSYTGGSITVNANSGWRTATLELVAKQTTALPSQFVQHVSTQSNENFETGNDFKVWLPNATGSGNALVIGLTHAHTVGRTVAITDSVGGNTYTLRQGPVTDGGATIASRMYVCEGIAAGVQWLNFHFDASLFAFQADITELSGIATSSAYDTGAATGDVVGPVLQPGSLTTGAANEIVVVYSCISGWGVAMEGNTNTGWRAGNGYRLITADRRVGIVTEIGVKAGAGAVNPAIYNTSSGDSYNTLAVALKTSNGAGTPGTGCRVINVFHTRVNAGTVKMSAPIHGNLQVLSTAYGNDQETLNSVTASAGSSWTVVSPVAGIPQIAYVPNLSDDATNVLTLSVTEHGSGNLQILLYDIAGADPSPYDGNAHNTGGAVSAGGNIAVAPSITPSRAGGVIIATVGILTGPPDLLSSPSGGIFDSVYYTGYTDLGPIDSGDGYAHVYPTSATAQSFTWRDSEATSGWFALALSFLAPTTTAVAAAPAPRPPPPAGFL